MTAIVGDKGSQHPHHCQDNTDGTNVLSVTFLPEQHTLVGWASMHKVPILICVAVYYSIQLGRSLQGRNGDQLCKSCHTNLHS